ncbi:MAG: undecaprenyldiphospho-muramoylpentapeptide beta-N-acetylglucosaminyltransferase [Phototrophicales bacterium]|nr:MAG: undecaprenyldiphospho-muramoylpentapeptide beta-N-acetylglucosaminyltransferase [Phototrophicales bacterium]
MIVAGGTGGHVYPALATAQALIKRYPDVTLHFVGTTDGFERPLVQNANVQFDSYDEVHAGPLHGVNPLRAIHSLYKLTFGVFQAVRVLNRHKPQVILSTGGWASLPVALAAWFKRIPMLIYLPDIEPGLTIKVLKRFATKVAITVPESAQYFKPGQTVVTGYPLRAEIREATRQAAIQHFNLDPQRQTLLVFGGSRGARVINIALGNILPQLLQDGVQVLHITGTLDWQRSQEQVAQVKNHPHYHAFPYLHDDMGLAFAAADLAVCRAGASILGEFPFFALPSILIPLAYNWRYQQVNADYLAQRGAAIHLDENRMQDELLDIIQRLFADSDELAKMKSCVQALHVPDGAENIARTLADMI